MSEGISSPFTEMTEETRSECIAWLRQQEQEKILNDPVHYFRLETPDGEPLNRDVYEMHLSQATELNEQKIFDYMASERNRAQRIAEWKAKVKQAEAQADLDFRHMKERAAAAALVDVPLPDSKAAWQLLEFRRSHVVEVVRPEPQSIPFPDVSYTEKDALWVRTTSSGVGVVTMPDTLRCNHD